MSTYKYDVEKDINQRTLLENAAQQNRQYLYDSMLQQQAQDFQISEHQRNFEDWQRQFELENEEYERRIQSQRSYDSIQAQVARAREIGVNPSAAIGVSQQGTAFAAPQPGTVNAPSSPSSPSVSALPTNLQKPFEPTEQFLNIIDGLSKLNKSGLDFVEQYRAQQMFIPQFEMAMQQVTGQRLQNSYDSVRNIIQGHTGLDKAFSDIAVNWTQAYLNNKKGDIADVEKFLVQAQKDLTDRQFCELGIRISNLQKEYDTLFDLREAQSREANAASESYKADVPLKQAQTYKTGLEGMYQLYENNIKSIENDATLSPEGKYWKMRSVITSLEKDARKNGNESLANEIDTWEQRQTDPRDMDDLHAKIDAMIVRTRKWIFGK